MKKNTIQQIEEQVDQVTEALKGFVLSQHKEERYGQENEYTAKSLKADINAVLTDIRGLVKAHNKFLKLSTFDERTQIRDLLEKVSKVLDSKDYSNLDLINTLETLKPLIRGYNVRDSSETKEVYEERLTEVNSELTAAEENINEIERIRETAERRKQKLQSIADQQEQQLQSIKEQLESLDGTISESQEKAESIKGLENRSQGSHQVIQEAQASVESQKQDINNFFKQIAERENQLTDQKQFTDEYKKKLTSFEKEHEEKLEAAEELKKQAQAALEYGTAAGISAAFTVRYNEEKKRDQEMSKRWLIGALFFTLITIGIGILIVVGWWGNQDIGLGMAVSRIAIMLTPLSGAWFCAAQYAKYRNICEDYGYKAVLSKSMVGFMGTFSEDEDVKRDYLKTVLKEIHQHPLRKRYDNSDRKNTETQDMMDTQD